MNQLTSTVMVRTLTNLLIRTFILIFSFFQIAFAFVYFLFFMPKFIPWSAINSSNLCLFFAISHVFATIAPWFGSTIYHLFMNHNQGQLIYNKLLNFDVFGIWITQGKFLLLKTNFDYFDC